MMLDVARRTETGVCNYAVLFNPFLFQLLKCLAYEAKGGRDVGDLFMPESP